MKFYYSDTEERIVIEEVSLSDTPQSVISKIVEYKNNTRDRYFKLYREIQSQLLLGLNLEIIISFKKKVSQSDKIDFLKSQNLILITENQIGTLVKIDESKLELNNWDEQVLQLSNKIHNEKFVDFSHPNVLIEFGVKNKIANQKGDNENGLFNEQWHLENKGKFSAIKGTDINVNEAWLFTRGENCSIAIIDDGFDIRHDQISITDFDEYDLDRGGTVYSPLSSHGTACLGLIASKPLVRSGKLLCSGVAPESHLVLVQAKTFDSSFTIAEKALLILRDKKVNVISYSGDLNSLPVLKKTINELYFEYGILLVAPTGNDNKKNEVDFPARLETVLGVGAVSCTNKIPVYSNGGKNIDVVAPAKGLNLSNQLVSLVTTKPNNGYYSAVGSTGFGKTSGASAIAAGVAGLVFSVNPSLRAPEVLDIIRETANKKVDVNDFVNGFSPSAGYGRINAGKAVKEAIRRRDQIMG